MTKIKKIITSRTNWVILTMFLVGGVEAIADYLPDSVETLILGALGLIGVYFKMNPSQDY